jgi:hypothetical protein
MLGNAKALIVVLGLAAILLPLYFRGCASAISWLHLVSHTRLTAWFVITAAAFLSPNIWIFATIAVPLLLWATFRDPNPVALFSLLVYAVPPVDIAIPAIGINYLFGISFLRMLALCVLIPSLLRNTSTDGAPQPYWVRAAKLCLWGYIACTVVLQIPYESYSNTMRRAFIAFLDMGVIVLAFGNLRSREKLLDALLMFVAGVFVASAIGVFEAGRGWLLYTGVASAWGDPNVFSFLLRGDLLRAQAGAGHSLEFGFCAAVSLGFVAFLVKERLYSSHRWLILAVVAAGLISSFSRGPWLTGLLMVTFYIALAPGRFRSVGRTGAVGLAVVASLLVTDVGKDFLSYLPIVGGQDLGNVDYRQQLIDTSIPLIKQNPFFGSPFVAQQLEVMRQGQGIIDIVNGYLRIALFYGLVTLALFLGIFIFPAIYIWTHMRRQSHTSNPLGRILLPALIATLFFMGVAGYGTITYVIMGLLISHGQILIRETLAYRHQTNHERVASPAYTSAVY